MKAKKIFLLSACTFFLLGSSILAGCSSRFFRTDTSVSQTQLNYLKKHQDEIKDFIKSLNPKVESVQIRWSQTKWGEVGNGTPQGGGEVINVYGGINKVDRSSWSIIVGIDDKGKIDLDSMELINPLRMNGEIFK